LTESAARSALADQQPIEMKFVEIPAAPIPKSAVGRPLRRVTRDRYLATVEAD